MARIDTHGITIPMWHWIISQWHHYTFVARIISRFTVTSLRLCGSNYITIHNDTATLMWLELYHSGIKLYHIGIKLYHIGIATFCGSNYITVTSLHFCGSNYITIASLHLCGTKLYYCGIALLYGSHYPLAYIRGSYIFYGSYYSPVACILYVLAHSLKCIFYWAALQISMVRLYLWVIYAANVICVIMIYGRSGDKTFDDSDNSMITRLLMTVIIVWL